MTRLLFSRVTLVWLVLVGATLISWSMGDGLWFSDRRVDSVIVIVIAFVKIFFVMMDFMEIRHAPLVMRAIGGGWITIVCTALATVYWLGTEAAMQAVWPHINGL